MSAAVRAGYKQTEVGVIPEDWDVLPISALTTEFRGGAPLKPTDFVDRGIKVLPKGGVGRIGILYVADKDIQYCRPEYADAHPRNQVDKAYTIVVLRDLVPSGPSIGLMVEIDTTESFVLAQGVYGFKVNKERADARYLIQLSNTSWYRNLANSIMVGSTQVHITNTAYKKAVLPVPPPPRTTRHRHRPVGCGCAAGQAGCPRCQEARPQSSRHAATPHRPDPPAGV